MPLNVASIDFTKVFYLVSRDSLVKVLLRIGCPLKLLSMIISIYNNMKGTVQFKGSFSYPFIVVSNTDAFLLLQSLQSSPNF